MEFDNHAYNKNLQPFANNLRKEMTKAHPNTSSDRFAYPRQWGIANDPSIISSDNLLE
jgi:hypothetical protein